MLNRLTGLFLLASTIAGTVAPKCLAEDLVLKSQLVVKGRLSSVETLSSDPSQYGERGSYTKIDARYKAYFVPNRNIAGKKTSDGFAKESFKLKHKVVSQSKIPDYIGGFTAVTPFDGSGVRKVTLRNSRGQNITVLQAIDEITPEYLRIKSLSHRWNYGIATSSVPPATLSKLLDNIIDQGEEIDHRKVISLLAGAEQFVLADAWLDKTREKFADREEQWKKVELVLRAQYSQSLIEELKNRRAAGQHRLVRQMLGKFPTNDLPAVVKNEVQSILTEYDTKEAAAKKILEQLAALETALNTSMASKVKPLREELQQNLDVTSIDRLGAYVSMAKDKTLKPEERLAVAYSGWLLGSAEAITSLPETIGLAAGRKHVQTYFSSDDPLEQRRAVDELKRLEGVSPQRLKLLLAMMPPAVENTIVPLQPTTVTVETEAGPVNYRVVLPPEYSPFKSYPMLVTLRAASQSPDFALSWWCGTARQPTQAPRHGYIVIAPEYLPVASRGYVPNPESHHAVMSAIRDALGRFTVDPDRVFVSGQASGGDAAIDMALSHPDVFAGAIPICGIAPWSFTRLGTNAGDVPWYFVLGQKHNAALDQNAALLERVRLDRGEFVVCEYKDRGLESYYEEIHKLFEWMQFQKRPSIPSSFAVATVQPENNSWYWIEANGFRSELSNQDFRRQSRTKLKSAIFELNVGRNNSLRFRRRSSKTVTLRLMDDVIDFTKKVQIDRKRFNPEANIDDVLEDFSIYRDRSRIALDRVEWKP